jgi:hypothetical protein
VRPRRQHGAELLSHMRQKFGVAGNDHYDFMPSTVPRWHRGFSPVKQSNGESEASDFLMPWIMAETAELPALRNFVAYATKFRRARAEREHANFSIAVRVRHDVRKSEPSQRLNGFGTGWQAGRAQRPDCAQSSPAPTSAW